MSHYLVLEVICPILFSLFIVLYNNKWLPLIANFFTLCLCVILYKELATNGEIIYLLGDYASKYGIELKLTYFNFIFLATVNLISFICHIYRFFLKDFSHQRNTLLLLCLAGFNGILISNDIFNIYVFLELSSIASYGLLASNLNLPALHAAFNYLIFGIIGATFYLIGVGFLYLGNGTLNISLLSQTSSLAFFFIIGGILIKLAIFPIHNWLVNVYKYSENYLTGFFAGTTSSVTLYLLLLYLFNIFKDYNSSPFNILLQIIGILSMIYFGIIAWRSESTKEILLYSSFSQIGSTLLMISFRDELLLNIIIIQIVSHATTKSLLFILYSYNGSFVKFCNGVLIMNLIGLPPLFGFIVKFNFLVFNLHKFNWIILICFVIGIVFSILYGVKLFKKLVLQNI